MEYHLNNITNLQLVLNYNLNMSNNNNDKNQFEEFKKKIRKNRSN